MSRSRLLSVVFAFLGVALLVPSRALACPVCFGAAESPLLDSARMGVLTMVVVTAGVLAAFAAWFLRLRRLSRDAEARD